MVTSGSVLEVIDGRLLRLTWSDADWPVETTVDITMTLATEGTLVRVRHASFERLPDGRHLAREHAAGWRAHLSNLRSVAEQGATPLP